MAATWTAMWFVVTTVFGQLPARAVVPSLVGGVVFGAINTVERVHSDRTAGSETITYKTDLALLLATIVLAFLSPLVQLALLLASEPFVQYSDTVIQHLSFAIVPALLLGSTFGAITRRYVPDGRALMYGIVVVLAAAWRLRFVWFVAG